MTVPQMYDAADSILAQKLAQVEGVGQVFVGGAAQPAVRAEVNPTLLNKLGVGLDTVRNALNAGQCEPRQRASLRTAVNAWSIQRQRSVVHGGSVPAADRRLSTTARRFGSAMWPTCRIPLPTCATSDWPDGKPAVLIIVFRQPGANIIDTVTAS